jgi:hypothetical protein
MLEDIGIAVDPSTYFSEQDYNCSGNKRKNWQ